MSDNRLHNCLVCGRAQPRLGQPGDPALVRVCKACAIRTSQRLEILPAAFSACEALLSRASSKSVLRSAHASYGCGMPLNLSAADTRGAILSTLASWAKMVIDERGLTWTPARGVRDLVNFLSTHFDWLISHSAAFEFASEIEDLVRQAHGAVADISHPEPRKRTCAEPDCGQDLVVGIHDENSIKAIGVRCRAGHVMDMNQLGDISDYPASGYPARTVPTKTAAMMAGVSEATIRQWARRGKLTRYGPAGRAEYDIAEVIDLAAARAKIRADLSSLAASGMSPAGRWR